MKSTSKKSSPKAPPSKRQQRLSAQRRKRLQTKAIRAVAILAAVLAAVMIVVFLVSSNDEAGSAEPIEGVQSFPNVQPGHTTQPVSYDQNPPVGGPHNPAWQNCGVYTQPVANENAVHSLEHGAIWITYQSDLPDTEVQRLQTVARESGFRLLSPYLELPSPIVLSAWGYQLQLEQADDPRLVSFIEKYEQNPQSPEPGAPCTGGLGQPG